MGDDMEAAEVDGEAGVVVAQQRMKNAWKAIPGCQGCWHPRLKVPGSLVHSQGPVMMPGQLPGRPEEKGVRLR